MTTASGASWKTLYRSRLFIAALVLILSGLVLVGLPHIPEAGIDIHGTFGVLLRDIGVTLLIAGLVATFYETLTREAFMREVEQTLDRIISERYKELDQLRIAGLNTIHEELYYANVAQRFREASNSIRILQTWSGDFNALASSLKKAAERGCDIRILLLNPDSDQAKYRAKDLKHSKDKVATLTEGDLSILSALRHMNQKLKDNMTVKLYDATPVIAIYGCDDINIVGTYWNGRYSQEGPQYEVVGEDRSGSDNPYLSKVINDHFNSVWEESIEHVWEETTAPDTADYGSSFGSSADSSNGHESSSDRAVDEEKKEEH